MREARTSVCCHWGYVVSCVVAKKVMMVVRGWRWWQRQQQWHKEDRDVKGEGGGGEDERWSQKVETRANRGWESQKDDCYMAGLQIIMQKSTQVTKKRNGATIALPSKRLDAGYLYADQGGDTRQVLLCKSVSSRERWMKDEWKQVLPATMWCYMGRGSDQWTKIERNWMVVVVW